MKNTVWNAVIWRYNGDEEFRVFKHAPSFSDIYPLIDCDTIELHKGFHQDVSERRLLESEPKTAIFYINTNDGYTVFEDGTKINSVANRICIFPHWMKHSGTTCTNTNRRIALNLNFVR